VSTAPVPSSFEGVHGPIARTVADVAAMLDIMHGPAPGDFYWPPPPARPFASEVTVEPPPPLKVAVSTGGREVAPAIEAALKSTAAIMEGLGHRLVESDPDRRWGYWMTDHMEDTAGVGLGTLVKQLNLARPLDPIVEGVLAMAEGVTAERYFDARNRMLLRARAVLEWFSEYDLLLSPAVAKAPPYLGQHRELAVADLFRMWESYVPFTTAWNWTGQPALSLPTGFDEAGLPIGMQLVAKPAGEATLLQAAAQLEGAIGLSDRRPSLTSARGTRA